MEGYEGMKEALAAKGYDLVGAEEQDSDSDGMSVPGRIPSLAPDVAREKGKKAFEKGKYDRAIKHWQGGLKHILSALCAGPHALQDQSLSEMDLTLNLNIAMAYMKKEDYDMADKSVDKALARREALPPNLITKALYRKASAQRAMHRLDDCLETLKDMLEVEPGNSAALQIQQEVGREWQQQISKQKKNFKKMFETMSGEDKVADENTKKERAKARADCAVCWIDGEDVNSEAFELGETPASSGQDWGMAFSRTVLWAMEQFAVENAFLLPRDAAHVSAWFVGASSTCDLRLLQPSTLMSRLPSAQSVELALIGFLGELTPDNTREPDPQADTIPSGLKQSKLADGRKILLRIIKGSLKDALEKELRPASAEAPKGEAAAGETAAKSTAQERRPTLEAPKEVVADLNDDSPTAVAQARRKSTAESGMLEAAAACADGAVSAAGDLAAAICQERRPTLEAPKEVVADLNDDNPTAVAQARRKSTAESGMLEAAAAAAAAAVAGEAEPPPLPAAGPAAQVPPAFCIIAHPQLHRYFSDFYPAIAWLIQQKVPTVIIGASEPDPSWKQDEVLLKAFGCNIVVSKRESPYPMCLPDNPNVKKCNHIIGFLGGKAIERDKLVKTKLDLLGQDYTVR